LNPAMPKAYYTRGVAYQALGLLAKARKYREVSKVKR